MSHKYTFHMILIPLLAQSFTVLPRTLRSSSVQNLEGIIQNVEETPQGVVEVGGARRYLKQFGYLEEDNVDFNHTNSRRMNAGDGDEFDEGLEKAIRMFQKYYQLNESGKLDLETTKLMSSPRCGVPDHDHGMKKKQQEHVGSKLLKITSKYAFAEGNPRWSKRNLTYKFRSGVEILPIEIVREAFKEAFAKWSSVSSFTFMEVPRGTKSDIVIGFFRGDHGDGAPFDKYGGVVAHAFTPTDGRLHVNADKPWSTQEPIQDYHFLDLVWAAMHEIGHVLGLDHSNHRDAVMYPLIDPGANKRLLRADDIIGIRRLYSSPVREDSPRHHSYPLIAVLAFLFIICGYCYLAACGYVSSY